MKILLINANPVVSRLTSLSARKENVALEETQNDISKLKKENYDVVFVDFESYSDKLSDILSDLNISKRVLFHTQEDREKPKIFNITILKPFLPSEVSSILRQVKMEMDAKVEKKLSEEKNIPFPIKNSRHELEKEKREKEKREKERIEQEKREKERIEQEKREKERIEQEKREKERIEQEKREKERIEQEKREKERIEQEKREKERIEQEKREKERIEQEKREKERIEQEKREQEKIGLISFTEEKKEERDFFEIDDFELDDDVLVLDGEGKDEVIFPNDGLDEEKIEKKAVEKIHKEKDIKSKQKISSAKNIIETENKERKRVIKKREKSGSEVIVDSIGSLPIDDLRRLLLGAEVHITIKFPKE